MTSEQISEKKEKSLAELLMIVVIIGVLMATFWQRFDENEQVFTDTGFNALANSFTAKVQIVHAQWLMDKQPNIVKVKDIQGDSQRIFVNKYGWIDSNDNTNRCIVIWQQAMKIPLELMRAPISVVTVNRKPEQEYPVCRYALSESVFFEYHVKTGKITL